MDAVPTSSARTGFDVVIGNPPFVNAIEGGVDESVKPLLRYLHPQVGGTSDLGYYFLHQAASLAAGHGRVGLVLPRAVLNASPVEDLRRWLLDHKPPACLYAGTRANHFPGASVFVALVVLGSDSICEVGMDADPRRTAWRMIRLRNSNWWQAVFDACHAASPMLERTDDCVTTAGDHFEITASMTTGEAYELKPFLVDDERGTGLKLVTTGLIETDACLWGHVECRYLGRRYRWPRISERDHVAASLQRRIERARRPKLIVAGLSKRIESMFDSSGTCIGAVSTWTITHPDDDIESLAQLQVMLHSLWADHAFQRQLGGNALGGGNVTMKKTFLSSLPLVGVPQPRQKHTDAQPQHTCDR